MDLYSHSKPASHDAVNDYIFLVFIPETSKTGGIVRVDYALSCKRKELYTKRCSLS